MIPPKIERVFTLSDVQNDYFLALEAILVVNARARHPRSTVVLIPAHLSNSDCSEIVLNYMYGANAVFTLLPHGIGYKLSDTDNPEEGIIAFGKFALLLEIIDKIFEH